MSSRIAELAKEPSAALVDEIEALIPRVIDAHERGGDPRPLVAEINRLSGIEYDLAYFVDLHSWIDERDAAAIAAKGPAPIVARLTRDELIEIIEIILLAEEPASSFLMGLLDRNFPGSWSSDLLFYSHREMTKEEVVDELLLREKLFREGGWEAVNAYLVGLARSVLADPDAAPWAQQWANSVAGARS